MSAQSNILSSSPSDAGAPLSQKHESLFRDAMRRLVRNKAAVVGGIIVIALLTMSLLAGVIAPYSYETQVRVDNNKVPAWVVTIFPSMAPYAKISASYALGADDLGRGGDGRQVTGALVTSVCSTPTSAKRKRYWDGSLSSMWMRAYRNYSIG